MNQPLKNCYKRATAYFKAYRTENCTRQKNKFIDQEWLYYGTNGIREQIERSKRRFDIFARIVIIFTVIVVAVGAISSGIGGNLEEQLIRPDYGEMPKNIQVNAKAEYRGAQVDGKMDLLILPKELTSAQESERLELCAAFLAEGILNQNESLAKVTGDLNLIVYHEPSGVSLSWSSTDSVRINTEGQVYLIDIKKPERVTLQAVLSIGKSEKKCSYSIVLRSSGPADYVDDMQRNLTVLQDSLSKDSQGPSLRLPSEALGGIKVKWVACTKGVPIFLIPIAFLLIAASYFSRYDRLNRASKHKKEAVEEEVPNLALQLILLLNSGLVVSAAFDEILDQNQDNDHPLYPMLKRLSTQSAQTNLSFIRTFYTFSQQTGNRNLLRFATMVADHETRGSELVNKLERERDQLWESRLQRAKAKAREADTKLCMPLMLLLLALVVISVAPALMEM